MSANKQPSLAVLSSRLTSATLPSDAIAALSSLLDAIRQSYKLNGNDSSANAGPNREPTAAALELASSPSVLGALCTLLGGRPSYLERDHGAGRLVLDGGDGGGGGGDEVSGRGAELACELALAMLGGGDDDADMNGDGSTKAIIGGIHTGRQKMAKLASTMLTFAAPETSTTEGQFLNAILDRLCPTEEDGAAGDGTAGGGGGIGGGAVSSHPGPHPPPAVARARPARGAEPAVDGGAGWSQQAHCVARWCNE